MEILACTLSFWLMKRRTYGKGTKLNQYKSDDSFLQPFFFPFAEETYIYIYTHTLIYVYIYMHICTHTHICVCVHICMYV